MSGPAGLAVDAAGNLYIADAGNFRVRMVAGGAIATIAGNGTPGYTDGPAANAQFNGLAGLAVDSSGNLYIADFYNQAVRMVSHGAVTTVAGNGTYGASGDNLPAASVPLAGPSGIALDSAGNLYIADTGNNRVRMISGGVVNTVAGTGTYGFIGSNGAATSATLGAPSGVTADSSGNLYITDACRVLEIAKGKIAAIAGLDAPQGVAVDAAGNVYVANPASHRVYVLTPAATACAVAVTPTSLPSPTSGGNLTIAVQTGPSCPWAVESLPAWVTLSGSAFGTGPATVTLAVTANSDAPRSAARSPRQPPTPAGISRLKTSTPPALTP